MRHAYSAQRIDPLRLSLAITASALLALAFIAGGSSIEHGWDDTLVQLLALPVMLLALVALTRPPLPRQHALLIALAFAPVLVLLLQILLGTSKTPTNTERALWAWVPPIAIFLATLALPASMQRKGLLLIVLLAAASLALAFIQLAAPDDSIVHPFPSWAHYFNGVFANPNHQAAAMVVGAVLLLAMPLAGGHDHDAPRGKVLAKRIMQVGGAVLLLAAVPLTGSRGMALIGVASVLLLPWASGWMARHLRGRDGHRRRRRVIIVSILVVVALAFVAVAATGWLQHDRLHESRSQLAAITASLATKAMPWGSGAGSFAPWFEANMPQAMYSDEYYNQAHNEYVQWWLEGGVFGLAWIVLLAIGMAWARPRGCDGHRPDPAWVGSWIALACLLAHSFVDYPMRTPALAAAAAWMAATAVSATLRNRRSGAATPTISAASHHR